MSQSNAPRTTAENRFRPLSSQERLGALVHDIVNEMLRVNAEKTKSDQGHPIEDFHGDNRIQKDCIRQFCAFDKRVVDLENGLDQFEREVRRLGSSSGLIRATHEVRKHLLQLFDAFRSDSESIYRMFGEKPHYEIPDVFRPRSLDYLGPTVDQQQGILELFEELSDDLEEFLNSLLDIPEFTDKRLTDSIGAFQGWLEYRAGGLEDFKEDLHTPAVKLYAQSLMEEMSTYLKHTENAIQSFAKDGVAAIKSAQNRSQVQLQNMSTVVCDLVDIQSP
ncbi:hypothetical protein FS837_008319 [Tulasnella sp. UAMH 9824]|nr:hypothetical protein FS837_008319 [Tulasnella sp. UAMH 9824]